MKISKKQYFKELTMAIFYAVRLFLYFPMFVVMGRILCLYFNLGEGMSHKVMLGFIVSGALFTVIVMFRRVMYYIK